MGIFLITIDDGSGFSLSHSITRESSGSRLRRTSKASSREINCTCIFALACLSADIHSITSELFASYPDLRLREILIRSLILDVIEEVTYSIKKRTLIKNIKSDITRIEENERKGFRIVFLRAYLSMRKR